MRPHLFSGLLILFLSLASGAAFAVEFKYCPPGDLVGKNEAGYTGRRVFLPDVGFPVGFAQSTHRVTVNSQMYSPGGICHDGNCSKWGNEGSQCDAANYRMPWRDTFCEKAGRRYDNALCPDGGHQGMDIRPPAILSGTDKNQCKAGVWAAVAVVDGVVSRKNGAVITIRGADQVSYTYRHLLPGSIKLKVKDKVKVGDQVGLIANFNNAGSKPYTTIHLHIEAATPVGTGEMLIIPTYTSFISAYRKAVGLPAAVDAAGDLEVTENEIPDCS